MLRATLPTDTDALCTLATETGVFYPHEVVTLRDVLIDYHLESQAHGHICKTWEDGQPLGFAYYAPEEITDRAWELWWIVVAKEAQGQGLGRKLMAAVESDLRHRGARLLLIDTSSLPRYDATNQFYRKLGFREVARVPDFYTDGDDKILYWKKLPQFPV